MVVVEDAVVVVIGVDALVVVATGQTSLTTSGLMTSGLMMSLILPILMMIIPIPLMFLLIPCLTHMIWKLMMMLRPIGRLVIGIIHHQMEIGEKSLAASQRMIIPGKDFYFMYTLGIALPCLLDVLVDSSWESLFSQQFVFL